MSTSISRRAFGSLSIAVAASLIAPKASGAESVAEASVEAIAARDSVETLSALIDLQDYASFRRQLRIGPMGRVRASCSALYRDFAEGDKRRISAEKLYKDLIKAVENADSSAMKAERGGDGSAIPDILKTITAKFDQFLVTVELS